MSFLETKDGIRLFYNDWGTGRPIVLVSGWPLSSDMWEYQASSLASAGFRVITYDRRGFGRSDQPFHGYDYDTLTADLAAVLHNRDVRDALLVGFSMGGGEVARYMSKTSGGHVSRVAFISSVTPFLMKTSNNPEGVEEKVFGEMVQGLANDRPAFLASFAKKFYGDGLLSTAVSKEILEWNQGMALQASPRATLECVRSFSGTDFRADLASIRVPTLVIHGDADQTVPVEVSGRRTSHLVLGATYKEYAKAPHGLFVTEKERLLTDLLMFAR